ncbi:MAG: YoaK family protein [Clostridium sp.]
MIRIWIYCICFLSAFINMCGYLHYSYSLSHYTGNIIDIALRFFDDDKSEAIGVIGSLIFFFVCGGIVGGFINRNKEFAFESRYGNTQLIFGVVLVFLYFLFPVKWFYLFFCALLLGIENSLIRSYNGLGFRTTHVTGTLSDLGTYISYYLQGNRQAGWKIMFEISLVVSFFLGSITGIFLYVHLRGHIFLLAGILFILSGLIYRVVCKKYFTALSSQRETE